MTAEFVGTCGGLLGALLTAVNFALIKDCEERYAVYGVRLVAAVHIFLAMIMLPLFVLFRMDRCLDLHNLLLLVSALVPYAVGQYLFYTALKLTDSSVISPFLALKIPFIALLAAVFLGQTFNARQLTAVAVIVGLSWYLSARSGRVKFLPFVLMCGVALFYSLTDMQMTAFTLDLHVGEAPWAWRIVVASVCQYLGIGLPAALLCRPLRLRGREILGVRWAATMWMSGGAACLVCFCLCGVVSGNILQSLRGIFGVLIGFWFYRSYIHDRMGLPVKLAVACAMSGGVVLYYC